MPENEEQLEKKEKNIRWYVIHTYSGYENKVQDTLTRKVHSMGLEDTIKQILLPMQDEEEVKDGQKKVVSRKVFPGYLLIEMEVNDHSWYVVRNTPGVTGFVGTTTKPTPLSDEEVDRILHEQDHAGAPVPKITVNVGDRIRITQGAFTDQLANVSEVFPEKGTIRVLLDVFGTATPTELDASQFEAAPEIYSK